ncbi:hypothetical protein EFU35_03435, partial [Vibrio cholerae]|nr:hypothetical protein [Vibrio cholerae]
IPVFILYDVQSSQTAKLPNCQTAKLLILCLIDLVYRLVVYLHRAIKKADALASARIVLCD